eukprot:6483958-Amphidinium_carterae.1
MEVATFMDNQTRREDDQYHVMRRMLMSTLLIGITTLVMAVYTSWKLCQQRSKPQTQEKSTQTPAPHDSDGAQDAQDASDEIREEIFVYPQGKRFHTRWN